MSTHLYPGHIGRGGCGALSPATVRHLGATVAPEGEPASLGPTPPPPRALIVDMRSSQVLLSERLQINDSAHLKYLETVRCTAHALLALAKCSSNARNARPPPPPPPRNLFCPSFTLLTHDAHLAV